MEKETKPEMTAEEFCQKWGSVTTEDVNWIHVPEVDNQILSDLRSVIRGKLVEYDKWLCGNSERLLNIPTSEKAVDEFLKDNQ